MRGVFFNLAVLCSLVFAWPNGLCANEGSSPLNNIEFSQDVLDGLGFQTMPARRAVYPSFPHVENDPSSDKPRGVGEQHFAVFIEFLKYFVNYVSEFEGEKDRFYTTIGDFRAWYLHAVSPRVPELSWQAEVFRTTNRADQLELRTEGGGAGIRADLRAGKDGLVTLTFLPIYGERRVIRNFVHPAGGKGKDFIARASLGAAYSLKTDDRIEPGVKVFMQPQWVDFGQYRVYVEGYVRLKVLQRESQTAQYLRLEEINLLPKVVYWVSTDEEGVFGDPISEMFGNSYLRLNQDLFAFINLEFRFRM